MASTVSNLVRDNAGSLRLHSGVVTLGTYATGGIALSADQVGLSKIKHINLHPTGGLVFTYNYTTGKVLAYQGGGFTPSGTIVATAGALTATAQKPAFVIASGTPLTDGALFVDTTGAAAKVVGSTAITVDLTISSTNSPVAAPAVAVTAADPTAAFSGTAVGAAVFTELGAVDPGVSINFEALGY